MLVAEGGLGYDTGHVGLVNRAVALMSLAPSPPSPFLLPHVRRVRLLPQGGSGPQWVRRARAVLPRRPSMGRKLYVGNLTYGVTNSTLEQMFAAHGTVESAQVIMDRDTGRSKGFGFVEMKTDQEAQAAIAAMNGKEVDGRSLTVNEAKPREDRGGGRGGSGGGRGGYGGGRGGYGGGGGRRY